jgi:hypothetical protein
MLVNPVLHEIDGHVLINFEPHELPHVEEDAGLAALDRWLASKQMSRGMA